MPKLLSKTTIASIAIAATAIGTIYLTSASRGNNIVNSSNSILAKDNSSPATLVSIWDKETEPNYSGTTEMTVYRSPNCGCCSVWVEHAQKHGFKIEDIKTDEMEALKQKHNIPPELASCHTTIIDGYVMEGHIPVDDIKRFLAEKPDMVGLAVPGMPIGTPGMEAKDIKQPFQILAFNDKGEVEVYKEYQSY
ncbi:DUF411 domain-containing protein [Waterburya agarophytonicola K14]|uniref:DUF411 domain-containing protein n=1 Tax=Waterburya agarophytonicola KI4 TaxID=2874699 RepID=A0A964BSH5_9CYAN|nr:DUF411 domain-containing protein [Waterburya agarophytonicola]MCC0178329.1 DUF411 domain-containing protein [Waterburya agarophytonicola KI4]